VLFDSAVAEDQSLGPKHADAYRPEFARVAELQRGAGESWFVTHRPPYTNEDERATMGDALVPFSVVLAGHLHFFAALNLATYPPLIVNGEGGTKLDADYTSLLPLAMGNLKNDGPIVGSAHFGFAVYERSGNGWSVSLRDPDGKERLRCTLVARKVHC